MKRDDSTGPWVLICLLLILLFAVTTEAKADPFEVCWLPPTQFENGDPLLEADLDYYTLYVDQNELLNLDAIVGTWCTTFQVHVEGTYFLTMTVTHMNGMTSAHSNIATFTLGPRTPGAPTQVTVTKL